MEIKWLNDNNLFQENEPMMALIAFDESEALVSLLDDGCEHSILFNKMKDNGAFENYFRIIFNVEGADWIFICPDSYENITNKEKRINQFYNDGLHIISCFLKQMGCNDDIIIPKRYMRNITIKKPSIK